MPRKIHILLALVVCSLATPTLAQAIRPDAFPPKLEPLPEIQAPPGAIDEFEPAVTIRRRGEDTLEEYRRGGKVYMIKVTPGNGLPPYYLIDNEGSGQYAGVDAGGNPVAVPQWLLLEF